MASEDQRSAESLADMLVLLGRLSRSDGTVVGLTPVQWAGLRYFARASRLSRTPSAFASFQGTTRGTASQTIKGLVAAGYLTRTRSPSDGRSTRLSLAQKGWTALQNDPFTVFPDAIARLPKGQRASLRRSVDELMRIVCTVQCLPHFGTCHVCAHLDVQTCKDCDVCQYYCRCAQQPLEEAEIDNLCIAFQPA